LHYRRARVAGGTYFFTLVLEERKSALLVEQVDLLRDVLRKVKQRHPFEIVALVVLPEHLHTVWRLPEGDADYPMRWSLIKAGFSRAIPHAEHLSESRIAKRERGIWQRRYWEHQISDERDLQTHVDYIHYNPVKHGLVEKATDWPYSTIHRYIERGLLNHDWGCVETMLGRYGE
jgi:putative transposase